MTAEEFLRRRLGGGDLTPHLVGNGGIGVGGEGETSSGIEVERGLPQADATGLQKLGVGEAASPLPTEDEVDQAVVLGDGWYGTCRRDG
jgi:hypothetical protein